MSMMYICVGVMVFSGYFLFIFFLVMVFLVGVFVFL